MSNNLPPLPFAVFDEFGDECEDQVADHYRAALAAQPVAQAPEVPDVMLRVTHSPKGEVLEPELSMRPDFARNFDRLPDGHIVALYAAAPSPEALPVVAHGLEATAVVTQKSSNVSHNAPEASKPVKAEAPSDGGLTEDEMVRERYLLGIGYTQDQVNEQILSTRAATPPAPCGAVEREALDQKLSHALQHARVAEDFIVRGAKDRPDLMCGYWDDACTHIGIVLKDLESLRAALATSPTASGVGEREALTHAQALALWHLADEAHGRTSAFEWFSAGIIAAEHAHGIGSAAIATQPQEVQKPVANMHVDGEFVSVAYQRLPDGKYDLYLGPQPEQMAQETENGKRWLALRDAPEGSEYVICRPGVDGFDVALRGDEADHHLDAFRQRAASASGKGG